MKYIIQKTVNETGSRPPIQTWGDYPIPDGFVLCPSDFLDTFTQAKGFVNITVEDGTVTAMTENTEAKQAFEAIPQPLQEPTEQEDTMSMLVDQEYRLTLIEMGL